MLVPSGRVGLENCLAALFVVQSSLLLFLAWNQAPVPDEGAHLTAGIYTWQQGKFDLYSVNPPLPRLIASTPTFCLGLVTDFRNSNPTGRRPGDRFEWSESISFVRENADQARVAMFVSRLTLLPCLLFGAWICWRWAGELYGVQAGFLAAWMWCWSPMILAWGATIMPDIPATVSGLAAAYAFRHWLKSPGYYAAVVAGLALGIAELTKMTLLVFFAVWPLLWLIKFASQGSQYRHLTQLKQLLAILLIGGMVINMGYAYSGTGETLGSYVFVSRMLAGTDSVADGAPGGNRFRNHWVGQLPVPLPHDYVAGADLQKLDFEQGLMSYLMGEWSNRGWWHYYLVCCIVKIPLGTWVLAGIALGGRIFHRRECADVSRCSWQVMWFEELILLLPAVALFILVSSQAGVNRHFRYLLPAFPFAGILISRAACLAGSGRWLVAVAATTNMVSCLCVYPYSMSYFNEIAGGPSQGPRYLLDSNVDWGQDVWGLAAWCRRHPDVGVLQIALSSSYSKELLESHNWHAGSQVRIIDLDQQIERRQALPSLPPGWSAIGIHRLYEPRWSSFQKVRPVARIGYSILIFHVAHETSDLTGLQPQIEMQE